MRCFPIVPFLLVACALAPGIASADDVKPMAPLVAVGLSESTSSEYASFHGFILVGDEIGGYLQYKWGGNHCPGLDVSSDGFAALQRGMNNPRVLIVPRTKPGAGGNQCLVGFTLALRSDTLGLP